MELIAGVDEAGRGALAGPVSAAAVVLDPDKIPIGIADSKILTPARRAALAAQIQQSSRAWAIVLVDHHRIDEVNILQATYDAMHQAIDQVRRQIRGQGADLSLLRIDGNRFRPHAIPHECLIKGDATDLAIGAASILAKTARDTWMIEVADPAYPDYGFAKHKGYGTLHHRKALRTLGPCEIHRRLFVQKTLATSPFSST